MRPKRCPQCGGPCFPEEVQGLCPSCLRRMLLGLEPQAAAQEPGKTDEKRADEAPPQSGDQSFLASAIALVLLLCVAFNARAQLVADGATNTLINVTNNITGDVIVGTNGSFTLLVISNNALLTNSSGGFIGFNTTARSNEVRLVSPTARWFMVGNLFVGSNGSFNSLVVSNGATVREGATFVAFQSPSSNNQALVTGSGSLWDAGGLYLGFNGTGNQLVVSNGGTLQSAFGYTGVAFLSSNLVVVTGFGSTWTNSGELGIGLGGWGNQLLVNDGGAVRSGSGIVGANASASNNLAFITGAGSVWSNGLDLNVGYFSANNQMIVSNGSAVFAGGNGLIGQITNANGNSVTLTDPGTRWSVAKTLYVGSNGALNQLVITNGASLSNNASFVGNSTSSSNNRVVVTGIGSSWRNNQLLVIGENGGANSLTISDGGFLSDSDAAVGDISIGNSALVTGANSTWSNRFELTVGYLRGGNSMVVSNGALVRSGNGYVGRGTGGTNCLGLVTGAGSHWTNDSDFYVGVGGMNNQMTVENGGRLTDPNAIIGANFSGTNNEVRITGSGSVWSNRLDLILGQSGSANRVVVTNGGAVISANGRIGQNSIALRNEASVTGVGSVWSNLSNLYVGDSGASNRLVASNGALVSDFDGVLGNNASSSNNLAVISGSGSIWSNSDALYVGYLGPANQLVISNGGLVQTIFGDVGEFSPSASNQVLVTDSGSVWTMSILTVGNETSGNLLVVANGGTLSSELGSIGNQASALQNEVMVTGAGSVWSNRLLVEVGSLGSGNRLTITNGGTVAVVNTNSTSTSLVIGASGSATNNRVVVNGGTLRVIGTNGTGVLDVRRGTNLLSAGLIETDLLFLTNASQGAFEFKGGTLITRGAAVSGTLFVGAAGGTPATWDIRAGTANHVLSGSLAVGQSSSFNQVLVTNGALLSSAGAFIGLNSSAASSNTVVIAGPGSGCAIANTFEIGSGGPFNSLVVSNGGFVSNNIGYFGSSGGRSLGLVTGAGSLWTNAAELRVGFGGLSNQLVVSDGGRVASKFGFIGDGVSSSNNLVLVTGSNAVFQTTDNLFFGYFGAGNQLVVSNGGGALNLTCGMGLNTSSNNLALVTGPGSVWTKASLLVGQDSAGNRLVVTNGGIVQGGTTELGFGTSSSNNVALVTGSGTALNDDVYVGFGGVGNLLVVSNSAVASGSFGGLGVNASGSNNLAVVTGSGSVWSNAAELTIGFSGSGNSLVVSNGGSVISSNLYIGANSSAARNSVWVNGGSLQVTTVVSNGVFEIRRGTNVLDAGLIDADIVRMTNSPQSVLQFNGGTLSAKSSKIYTSTIFRIGNGTNPATMLLAGNGLHDWAGNLIVQVTSNAVVTGNGIVVGGITFQNGSTLIPGTSIGKIIFTNAPSLQGNVVMEISKNSSALTNDQVQRVTGTLTYGGTLVVTNIGSTALVSGDRFPLFIATNYAGSFASLTLPPLSPGLDWTNKLLVDGSIQVVISPNNRFWTNDLGGSYQVAANWLGNVVPLPVDDAYFTNNSSYQVSWSADAFAANAFFNAQSGTVTQAIGSFAWTLTNSYVVGRDSAATAAVTHATGSLRITNSAGSAQFRVGELGRGTFNLSGGEVVTDNLAVTNGSKSVFNFTGGTLRTRNTSVLNGADFVVGTATSTATLELLSGGTNSFSVLRIQPGGILAGNGTVWGNLFMSGTLSPGPPQGGVGQLSFALGGFNLQSGGTNIFQINKAAATNDTVIVGGSANLGGTLVVANLAGTLTNGDKFQLFTAPSFTGFFSSPSLPALGPGLSWKNNTRLDGSIEVVATPGRDFGEDVSHFQGASGISQASWDQMFAEGKRFAFIKATEGLTGPNDAAMSNNVARATAAGLLAGVYHFAHPENRPTTNGAISEATNFLIWAGSAVGPGHLRPVLDLERGSGLSTSDLTDWVIAFANEVIAERGSGAAPIIYTLQNFANDELDSRLAGYDLWIRSVGSGGDPQADDPPAQGTYTNATGVFTNWAFWQYSDTGSSGGISPLDLDVCHSEYKPLASFRIPGPPASPIQTMAPGVTANGAFRFTFTNVSGALFTVLATTNISTPLSNWTAIGFPIEVSPGQFQFTDPQATNSPQRFYRVRSP